MQGGGGEPRPPRRRAASRGQDAEHQSDGQDDEQHQPARPVEVPEVRRLGHAASSAGQPATARTVPSRATSRAGSRRAASQCSASGAEDHSGRAGDVGVQGAGRGDGGGAPGPSAGAAGAGVDQVVRRAAVDGPGPREGGGGGETAGGQRRRTGRRRVVGAGCSPTCTRQSRRPRPRCRRRARPGHGAGTPGSPGRSEVRGQRLGGRAEVEQDACGQLDGLLGEGDLLPARRWRAGWPGAAGLPAYVGDVAVVAGRVQLRAERRVDQPAGRPRRRRARPGAAGRSRGRRRRGVPPRRSRRRARRCGRTGRPPGRCGPSRRGRRDRRCPARPGRRPRRAPSSTRPARSGTVAVMTRPSGGPGGLAAPGPSRPAPGRRSAAGQEAAVRSPAPAAPGLAEPTPRRLRRWRSWGSRRRRHGGSCGDGGQDRAHPGEGGGDAHDPRRAVADAGRVGRRSGTGCSSRTSWWSDVGKARALQS